MKKQAIKEKMRLADLIAEASYLLPGRIKNKDRIKQAKARAKVMEREEQKFGVW